jgi:hypothetical protein
MTYHNELAVPLAMGVERQNDDGYIVAIERPKTACTETSNIV